jgi:hypothetical protein
MSIATLDQSTTTAVRGLLIPADADQPLTTVTFTPDERGHLPHLRELLGATLTPVTALTWVDFVAGQQDADDEVNPRARAAAAVLVYSVAHGQFTVPGTDRIRARHVIAGEVALPELRGPVVVLGVNQLTGNFASMPEDMISYLLAGAEALEHLATALAHLYEPVAS